VQISVYLTAYANNPDNMAIPLDDSWRDVLGTELESEYFRNLVGFLDREQASGHTVYPPRELIFNAFNHTPFKKVKVVILGQDPYIGPGQAHGLAFSVEKGKLPPTLKNIFKELMSDVDGFRQPEHGNLTTWADQGVFLLNTVLTVRAGESLSHKDRGWEQFTDRAITELSARRKDLVFLLWGRHAHLKEKLIDSSRHMILKAAHPSPLSARTGFFGCRHFSRTNQILSGNGLKPINWQLP
jgi:uracil-DNA glycosylase